MTGLNYFGMESELHFQEKWNLRALQSSFCNCEASMSFSPYSCYDLGSCLCSPVAPCFLCLGAISVCHQDSTFWKTMALSTVKTAIKESSSVLLACSQPVTAPASHMVNASSASERVLLKFQYCPNLQQVPLTSFPTLCLQTPTQIHLFFLSFF
jgi:hypothetical protein